MSRLRDKYDDLSRVLKSYGDDVQCNETLSKGLLNYSKAYTLIGDVKDLEVQRLQTMVFFHYLITSFRLFLFCEKKIDYKITDST